MLSLLLLLGFTASVSFAAPPRPPQWPEPVLVRALAAEGHDLAWFRGLKPAEREAVLKRLFPLSRAAGEVGPPPPPTLQAAGLALDSPAAARLRLNSAFDGSSPSGGLSGWKPGYDLQVQNGQVRSLSLLDPERGLRVEVGQLGVVSRNPLVDRSLYGNLSQDLRWEGPVEASLQAQAAVVDLRARLFYQDAPGLDSSIASGLGGLDALRPGAPLGLPRDFSAQAAEGTAFQDTTLLVGSALGRVGKTFRLAGPFDLGLVAGALARGTNVLPNAVADQTAVLRWRAPSGLSAGLFGGVSEGLNLLGSDPWAASFKADGFKTDLHLEAAPHASAEVWGKLPGLGGSRFSAGLGRQFNPTTSLDEVHAATLLPVGGGALSISGRYQSEAGAAIEFSRRRLSLEVGALPIPRLEIYAGYARENMQYGDAGLNNEMLQLGLRGTNGPDSGSLEQIFGGQDELALPQGQAFELLEATRRFIDFLDDLDAVRQGAAQRGWDKLKRGYRKLDPRLKEEINDALRENAPGAPSLDDLFNLDPGRLPLDELRSVADALLASPAYERMLVVYMRRDILERMGKGERVPLLGEHVSLTAPMVLAAAQALGLGLSPVPPVTARDEREDIDPYLLGKFEDFVGQCPGGASAQDFTDCLLAKLPPEEARRLKDKFGRDFTTALQEAIRWHADLIRRQVNQLVLEVMLAAENLNELTVDQGRKLGDLDAEWLLSSFQKLDAGEKARIRDLIGAAKADLQRGLAREDRAIREDLTDYGRGKAGALRKQGLNVEVADADWPPLLAFYGDKLIERLAAAARRLPPGQVLKVGYGSFSGLGVVVEAGPDGPTVRLPPVDKTQRPDQLLDLAFPCP